MFGLKKYVECEKGNFSLLFGLTIGVLALGVAVATDVNSLFSKNEKLQDAADSGALAAAIAYSNGEFNSQGNSRKKMKEWAKEHMFLNLANTPGIKVEDIKVSVQNGELTLEADAKADLFFAKLLGSNTKPISVLSRVSLTEASYSQFIFLVDNSNSMSLPATAASMAKWKSLSGGCAFVCHDSSQVDNGIKTNLEVARDAGIVLQMDVVKNEIQNFADNVISDNFSNHSLFTLHTVGTTYEELATTLKTKTVINSAIETLEVETTHPQVGIIGPEGGDGWSYLEQGFSILNNSINLVGDGSSPGSRKTYVIFLTDGLDSYPTYRTFGPRYEDECQALKNMGAKLYTIHTKYPDTADVGVQIAKPKIPIALKNCASEPEFYYQADDSEGIKGAFNNILGSFRGDLRLVN